jgi:hypothetical protein
VAVSVRAIGSLVGAAAVLAAAPLAHAETRLTANGAGPLYFPPIVDAFLGDVVSPLSPPAADGVFTPAQYEAFSPLIGAGWFPGTSPEVVPYPASLGLASLSLAAPSGDQAVAIGQANLNADIIADTQKGQPVVIAGLSEGTLVLDAEEVYLASDPDAPPADELTFIEFGDPQRGLADTYLPVGFTVPILGYTTTATPDSQYNTIVVYNEYDGFGNPPDRPWDLLADVNALFGTVYGHNSSAVSVPADAVLVSQTTDSRGGVTTTYMIPDPELPMLLPLSELGVPASVIDPVNAVLTPIVNAGYSDLTPNDGPYVLHGQLVSDPPGQPPAPVVSTPTIAPTVSPAVTAPTTRTQPLSVPKVAGFLHPPVGSGSTPTIAPTVTAPTTRTQPLSVPKVAGFLHPPVGFGSTHPEHRR